ncbi:MAG TPA: hypothetical protein VMW66_03735, partial [Elusimicrobiales bacterium]|nr:hypothetical protein [Elusimicrobiales bacterium]
VKHFLFVILLLVSYLPLVKFPIVLPLVKFPIVLPLVKGGEGGLNQKKNTRGFDNSVKEYFKNGLLNLVIKLLDIYNAPACFPLGLRSNLTN